jgi:hypothetical protein
VGPVLPSVSLAGQIPLSWRFCTDSQQTDEVGYEDR